MILLKDYHSSYIGVLLNDAVRSWSQENVKVQNSTDSSVSDGWKWLQNDVWNKKETKKFYYISLQENCFCQNMWVLR